MGPRIPDALQLVTCEPTSFAPMTKSPCSSKGPFTVSNQLRMLAAHMRVNFGNSHARAVHTCTWEQLGSMLLHAGRCTSM